MIDEKTEPIPPIGKNYELAPPTGIGKIDKYGGLKSVLENYDVGEEVASILNLEWKQKVIVTDTNSEFGADYELPNTASVNYSHGAWGVAGIAHEMTHLIMGQNNWTDVPEIKEYIKEHEDLRDLTRMRTIGYPIEQVIAYLLMKDVLLKISDQNTLVNKEQVLSKYGESWFQRILEREYPTQHLKALGQRIIDGWSNKSVNVPITEWIKTLIVD